VTDRKRFFILSGIALIGFIVALCPVSPWVRLAGLIGALIVAPVNLPRNNHD
jgi:hypothetical protein